MIKLVGQTKLINLINSYTIDTVPHSLMFIGEEGCGKRTFATHLANNLKLELVDISEHYSDEELAEYSICHTPKMYLIDLRLISEKEQNKLLKFIEEPAVACFIVVITNSEVGVLDTILNRCRKLHFAQYTFDEMCSVATFFHPNFSELDYQICRTPGQLLDLDDTMTPKLKKLCENIITAKAPIAYGHILELYTKINCYENYDQYNFNAFLNMLAYVASQDYASTENDRSYNIYRIVATYMQKLTLAPKVNRHDFILALLSDIFYEVIR